MSNIKSIGKPDGPTAYFLLGEYRERPKLAGKSEEEIRKFTGIMELQQKI